jgi:hypothetical protein
MRTANTPSENALRRSGVALRSMIRFPILMPRQLSAEDRIDNRQKAVETRYG